MSRKVVVVFGTRPEAIKLAPVIRELEARRDRFITTVVTTSQHREILQQVLHQLEIHTDFDIDIMREDQTLHYIVGAAVPKLGEVFAHTKPDIVIVQGDTSTAFAAALAAFYSKVTVCHVEAGLRTYRRNAPFPEEINRQLLARLTDLHFAPTEIARANLLREGIPEETILVTGNTGVDALLWMVQKIRSSKFAVPDLPALSNGSRLLLVTCHRRESFGGDFQEICAALGDVAGLYQDVEIIYPVHPNPNVFGPAHLLLGDTPRIHLTRPLDYQTFIFMMMKAYLLLTDSGGVQEEAPVLGKPILVLRQATERPEAVEAGVAKVVGARREDIVRETVRLLEDPAAYREMSSPCSPFGDGKASKRIVDRLEGLAKSSP